MQRLAADIRRFARLDRPVLIQGESGTGKELVALALHRLSGRSGNWVPINVGGLTDALADSELFGHVRGAFTGALESRNGAFRDAQNGSLFLDEVADISAGVQVKLLRAIEQREVRPLGAVRTCPVNCRVVSACWADLPQRVAAGEFREDLYHRISTLTLHVPPLRQRRSDIPLLVEHFLRLQEREFGRLSVTQEALDLLVAYGWPGNVRQLATVLYRCAVRVGEGEPIEAGNVQRALPSSPRPLKKCTGRVDVMRLLSEHGGNASAAARAAGIPRSTFRAWIARTRMTSDGPLGGLSKEGQAAEGLR